MFGQPSPVDMFQAGSGQDFNTMLSKMIEMQNPLAAKLMPRPGDSSGMAFMKKLGSVLSSVQVQGSNGNNSFGFSGNTKTPGQIEMLKFLQGARTPDKANPALATSAPHRTGGLVGPNDIGRTIGNSWSKWDQMMSPEVY